MKKIFTLLLVIVFAYPGAAQPYLTGKRTISFIDNARSAREVPTDLYYPANTAGNNVPLATGIAKFPVVVFGHGFLISASSYKWLADSLVKNGYIVAIPTSEDGITPNHLDFGLDLAFLCTRVSSLNDSSASFLYQRVIKKAAVGGHSMGGGASFLAAAGFRPDIDAVFNFAAAETTPPATLAAFLNFKPTLVFSGSADCIAPDSVQEAMYNNTILACKTYVNITDALHCQFANNNLVCFAGQLLSGCGFSPVSTSAVLSKTTSLLIPWLDFYLKDICIRGEVFLNTYNNLTGITEKRRSCLPLPSCGPLPVKLISFTGNMKNDKANLYWKTAFEQNFERFVVERSADAVSFGQVGEARPKGGNSTGASYSLVDPYPFAGTNFYRLKMIDLDGTFTYSEVVKLEATKKDFAVTQLYPNPVKDVLHVQLQAGKRQDIMIYLYDIAGKQIQSNAATLNEGINESSISFSKTGTGTYILQYKNAAGNVLGTFKVVKD
jgi:dienelactone hydrolase